MLIASRVNCAAVKSDRVMPSNFFGNAATMSGASKT
jgi:hypothetical protein